MNKGYNQNNINMSNTPNIPHDNEDFMYPEVYKKFLPICDQLIKEMENKYGNIYLSEDLLKQFTDEVIRRSGMDDTEADPYSKKDGDSIPTIREFNGGRHDGYYGRDRGHWRHYDRGALSDIAGILFLNQIFGRRRPFWRWR